MALRVGGGPGYLMVLEAFDAVAASVYPLFSLAAKATALPPPPPRDAGVGGGAGGGSGGGHAAGGGGGSGGSGAGGGLDAGVVPLDAGPSGPPPDAGREDPDAGASTPASPAGPVVQGGCSGVVPSPRLNLLERLVVVLVRSEGPLNVGSVARLCGNFGCALRLVQPLADRSSPDAIKMAHPSEGLLAAAPVFPSLAEALAGVSLAVATSSKIVEAAAAPWLSVARARLLLPTAAEQVALVFGNERTGLSAGEAAQCPRVVRLPTPGGQESLNLSHAVAVTLALFNAAAEGADALGDSTFRASKAAREALSRSLEQRLEARQFFRGDARRKESFAPRLKELIDKMDLSERDLVLLQDLLLVLTTGRQ